MISRKVKAFMVFGFIAIFGLLMLKFIIWGKEAFAPYIGV